MKAILLISNDFEITECLTTVDVLNRGGVDIEIVSMNDTYVISQNKQIIKSHKLISEVDYKNYDFLIISGGSHVFKNLDHMPIVDEINNYYFSQGKLCCYICAAAHLPGKLGLLEGYNYTVFPGCDSEIEKGTNTMGEVVVSKNVITARSMYYSCDFALAIIEYLLGKNQRDKIERQIKGL